MKTLKILAWGALVGILGGLMGLGGAEFRLPILLSIFNYRLLPSILINLVVSLITVSFSLIFRHGVIGLEAIISNLAIVVNILAGSLLGSYVGVHYATRINEKALNRVVVVFLVCLSLILIGHEQIIGWQSWQMPILGKIAIAWFAGWVIGIFSSLLGVAGGELIIPTIILIFNVDIKLAGSLSLVISIPTILMGLYKYKKQNRFKDIQSDWRFIRVMALGSILGVFLGSYLLKWISGSWLYIILGIILLISAFKLANHKAIASSI